VHSAVINHGYRMKRTFLFGCGPPYDVTYFWSFVEFLVLKWSVRPRARAF